MANWFFVVSMEHWCLSHIFRAFWVTQQQQQLPTKVKEMPKFLTSQTLWFMQIEYGVAYLRLCCEHNWNSLEKSGCASEWKIGSFTMEEREKFA
jgi:hypothetical protein